MALPKEVQDALSQVHMMVDSESEWADIDIADWQTIRAHLLSQEEEIADLIGKRDFLLRHYNLAESRLAAADALLRECRRMAARLSPTPHDLYEQIDACLQGATHDRA